MVELCDAAVADVAVLGAHGAADQAGGAELVQGQRLRLRQLQDAL